MLNILFLYIYLLNGFHEFTIQNESSYYSAMYYDYININDEAYIYETAISKDCKIILKNLQNQQKEYILEIKPEFSKFNTCNKILISNIQMYNDTIVFVTSDKVCKYNYNPIKDEFDFYEVIDLENIFQKQILYYGNIIFLDYPILYGWKESYNSKRTEMNLYYYKVNLNDNISEFYSLDLPKGFYWTIFQPRNVLDFTHGKFLYTHITDYKIYINNFRQGTIDTIIREVPNWQSNTYSNDKFNGMHPAKIAEYLQKDTTINYLIHRANFLNDSTLLICYSGKNDNANKGQLYTFKYDLWRYNGTKWLFQNEFNDNFVLNSNTQISIYQNYKIFNNEIYSLQLNEDDEKYHLYKFYPFNN